ncbi:class I SAM-dependent methyltransferase [Paenarthrobacter sp. PH39-S1]|uniref:class I SAM-dependent methyltransferase n=1 Tax=Paenarthrobacter sp. PH39-S1 TaxID=3046204 RepID=UPI0024BBB808|nr:class I SAM-dependent methyltransferase [Paenarthrobacter sp. PH39-S1]MDJ0357910.1 class I SAM-dependent methyltransferase [Paenarthrobacter sp. PH39-S1]
MVQRAVRVSTANGGAGGVKPFGNVTRGTTNPNRLRRVDRWLAVPQAWRLRTVDPDDRPLVVDLGYGASPTTAVELQHRLAAVNPRVHVAGIEIEPARVRSAKSLEHDGLSFHPGGFEIPVAGNPVMVRAFNVLRQYDEADVPAIWATVCARLSANGIFADGTCDEIGRRSTWVALERSGPVSLTLSLKFGAFSAPSDVAERLPKALIHHNVPGEKVHTFLQALDRAWWEAAPLASFGARQRWIASCRGLRAAGWPVQDGPARWRLGELTVGWSAVWP